MHYSHLLEFDFALTIGKHTQMTKENSKRMKDLSASNISHISRKPFNAYRLQLHTQVTLSKSRSETITMPMICSLIEHGVLPIFAVEGKVMLYFEINLKTDDGCQSNFLPGTDNTL